MKPPPRHHSPRLRFLNLAATAAMSSRSSYRGSGRSQWRGPFSQHPGSGDSNPGSRPHASSHSPTFRHPQPHGQAYNAVPPPPFYGNQTFRPPPHQTDARPYYRNQNFRPLQNQQNDAQPFYGNQNFRPPPNQQHDARPFYGSRNFQPPQNRQNDTRPFYGNQNYRPPQNQQNAARPFYGNQNFRPQSPQFQMPRQQRPSDHRNWEISKSGPPRHASVQFKILSYNLLAEYLAINHRSKLYFHIPRYMLDWDWRKKSIIFELGWWSADILCFQEVDRFQDLEEDLKLQGYSGIWKMRTGDPLDGCAIFWRESRFKLLHEEFIEYNKLGLRDNVAQICVFELVNQNNHNDPSKSMQRLPSPNRVVVCNIHVLYNPKRGEIKLGQVRVLLNRAHDVSKRWDDAPVVLCGDFNCTPKSPLYNYISEQKLNLSDLPRDKVSGQASAEIRPQWQVGPNNRAPRTADNIIGSKKMGDSGEIAHPGSSNMHNERSTGASSFVPSVSSSPQLTTESEMCDRPTMVEASRKKIVLSCDGTGDKETHEVADKDDYEAQSALSVSNSGLEKTSSSRDREELFVKNVEGVKEPVSLDSSQKVIFHSSTPLDSCKDEPSVVMGGSENSLSVPVSGNAGIPAPSSEVDVSPEESPSVLLHQDMENLSLNEQNEGVEALGEDSSTFLAELYGENAYASHATDSEPFNKVYIPYDPSAWTPMEISGATGSEDCTLMEHSLKLKSSYTEVEDLSGTRDSHGEPLVTSYNRCFMGTVDYIWHSEGLKTVRVLAPIPKEAMQWTPGFPTKKWGSDHIALVSEFAFTNDPCAENRESS